MILDKGLIPLKTISELVRAYNLAMIQIDNGYESLAQARERLDAAFGNEYSRFDTLPEHSTSDIKVAVAGVKLRLKKNAWKAIIDRLEIHKILSLKRKAEFDKKFEDPSKMPPITEETVLDILMTLHQQSGEFAREMALEAYEFLMRGQRSSNTYKTNKKYARATLGKKVIITDCVDYGYGSNTLRVRYGGRADNLILLDKTFWALDGKGIPDGYRSPLVDAINVAPLGVGETDYFSFRAYGGTGTLHLTFKRLDLVTRLNEIAGNRTRIAD